MVEENYGHWCNHFLSFLLYVYVGSRLLVNVPKNCIMQLCKNYKKKKKVHKQDGNINNNLK